ncbi:MAG: cobalamin transport system ATP-binding protein [Thermotogaceae bacterium]|nr:cobalamin transport system ATP-binding protein [Thermotogaceae bacterium]MDN5338094.1 cobalamin transport system ATP-binding protein [Thermotogaceae bacterium]
MKEDVLNVENLSYSYVNGVKVLKNVNLKIYEKELVGIIGPNGSGKTTLLKCIAGVLRNYEGKIQIFKREVKTFNRKEVAKIITFVSQSFSPAFDFTVKEIVQMGRIPYHKLFQSSIIGDQKIVDDTILALDLKGFENRVFNNLSEGEKRRVVFAKALAQDTSILLLDEPFAHLDINYSYEMARLIQSKVKEYGKTVLGVFHNLNMASLFCDKIVVMSDGKIIAEGTPEEVYKEDIINRAFKTNCTIISHPKVSKPQVLINWS